MATADSSRLRYLALGDSYTIGEGVAENGRWPNVLAARLRQAGLPLADPCIVAETGWTTDELDAAITASNVVPPFDLVSLLIGVNNQYRGRSVDEYRIQLTALLDRALSFAGDRRERVFVVSIPDWTATPYFATTNRDFDEQRTAMARYNRTCREVADAARISFVNITPSTLAMASDATLVTEDGLHPSAALYARWVDQIYPVVAPGLAQSA